ncbi:MAG: carbon-nitrogen hydrolase [Candidatus Sumerlaeia bacterium]|nr:carbon-nitrogen hydrolase [Candidatus Sumerlaeia bacterium]
MRSLKVGIVQQSCSANRDENVAKLMKGIREAAAQGAKLVVLQELHNGPYFCQVEADGFFDLAETIPGPSTQQFGALAKELGIVLVTSLFEKRAQGLYHNTAVVFEKDGSMAGKYRKMHIPDDPGYYEKFYFTPGDLGFEPIETSVGKLGILVCWDQWYPEGARLMALAGADFLIYPTAIGFKPEEDAAEHERQIDAWTTIQRSHAVANGLPVISVNRTGFEPAPDAREGMEFWGQSFIVGSQGEFLCKAERHKEQVLVVDVDLERVDRVRRAWPFLRDRRIDYYGDLTKRFRD